MARPEAGTRVILPTGNFEQECIVSDPSEDEFGMVAARTTRSYTTRDAYNWPVRHPKGERILFDPALAALASTERAAGETCLACPEPSHDIDYHDHHRHPGDNTTYIGEAHVPSRAARSSGELDAAWAEAVAALPEGWQLAVGHHLDRDGTFMAWAGAALRWYPLEARGDTPAAALHALTEKLTSKASSSPRTPTDG